MNYIKSGWSYLSNSFTQSEEDINEDLPTQNDYSQSPEEAIDAVNVDEDQFANDNDDLLEFSDAVDYGTSNVDLDDATSTDKYDDSHERSLGTSVICDEISARQANVDDADPGQIPQHQDHVTEDRLVQENVIESVAAVEDYDAQVGVKETASDKESKIERYASLEASDSDDSGEFIPPPPNPVGRSENTASQLNEIIKNLGNDLDVLTLEDENLCDNTANEEKTLGESLYLTAYDTTIIPSPPLDKNLNTVKAEENSAALEVRSTIPGSSAVASPSCELSTPVDNFKESEETSNRPVTPSLQSVYLDTDSPNTPDTYFGNCSVNTTIHETEATTNVEIAAAAAQNHSKSIQNHSTVYSDRKSEVVPILNSTPQATGGIDSKNGVGLSNSTSSIVNNSDFENSNSHLPVKKTVSTSQEESRSSKNMEECADEIPISRGAYTIDFDNLESFNPFQTSKGIQNSPDLPSKPFPGSEMANQSLPEAEKEKSTAIENNHVVDYKNIADSTASNSDANTEENVSHLPQTETPEADNTKMVSTKENTLSGGCDTPAMTEDYAEDAIPISRGAYTLDLDNLDSLDPFETSKGLSNSPTKSANYDPFKASKTLSSSPPKSPVKNNIGPLKNMGNNEVPDVLPEPTKQKMVDVKCESAPKPSSELITTDSGNLENVDPVPKKLAKKPVLGANRKKITKPKSLKKKPPPVKTEPEAPVDGEDEIVIPKGSYTINFDDLDAFDPFKTSKGLANSPTKTVGEKPFTELAVEDQKTSVEEQKSSAEEAVESEKQAEKLSEQVPAEEKIAEAPVTESPQPAKKQGKKKTTKKPPPIDTEQKDDVEQEMPIPKGAYSFDLDNLDAVDPFKTSKGLQNSPTGTKTVGYSADLDDLNAIDPFKPSKAMANSPTDSPKLSAFMEDSESSKPVAKEEPSADEKVKADIQNSEKPAEKSGPKKKKTPQKKPPTTDAESKPDGEDEIPIPKGSYNLDFDNLDAMDPFKTSKGLANSPTEKKSSAYSFDLDNLNSADPFKSSKALANSPPGSPVKSSAQEQNENVPVESSSQQPAVKTENLHVEMAEKDTNSNDVKKPKKKSGLVKKGIKKPSVKKPPIDPEPADEEEIPIPKGAYNLDFDNLDAMDPFKTTKGLAISPTEKKSSAYSFDLDNLDDADPFKPSKAMANSPPGSPTKPRVQEQEVISEETLPQQSSVTKESLIEDDVKKDTKSDVKKPKKKSGLTKRTIKKPVNKRPPADPEPANDEDDIPIPKGAYNLDFDNLDAMDPFKTSKGLSNSPTEKKSGYSIDFDNLDMADPFKPSKAMANSPPSSPTKTNNVTAPEQQEATIEKPKQEVESDERAHADLDKPKKKSSGLARKKLIKPGLKKPATKVDEENNSEEPPSLPKGDYNLDFDNLEAMDPFKSSKGLANSPTKETALPTSGYSVNLDDLDSVDPFKPRKSAMMNSPVGSPTSEKQASEVFQDAKAEVESNSVDSVSDNSGSQNAKDYSTEDLNIAEDKVKNIMRVKGENPDYKKLEQMEFEKLNENEEFYPASSVFQDSASLDYLDRLAGTKAPTASDLRKQSLYVKFDPLVSASPAKQIENQLAKDEAAKRDFSKYTDNRAKGDSISNVPKEVKDISQLSANVSTVMDLHTSMDSVGQPYASRQSSSLKYTQADFEAAMKKAEQKWQSEREESQRREEELQAELEQMGKVVSEYDRLFAEMANNGTRNGMLTREQQLLTAEHEQSLEDMAALERSHEDLCRRYNRLKTVVAQFKRNEETLKQSTKLMVEEARETEKKFKTLKLQSDEKIRQANDELQSVKANAQQEVARAQAQLKLLELKCDSMQNQIQECTKENTELTKLCDDLIACSKQ